MAKDVLKRKNDQMIHYLTYQELQWELARVRGLKNFNKSSKTRYLKVLHARRVALERVHQLLNQ